MRVIADPRRAKTWGTGMNPYRLYWIQYVTPSAFRHGLVPMYWDTGELFDHTTSAVKDAKTVDRIMGALP